MRVGKVLHMLFGVALIGVLVTSPIGAIPNSGKMTYFTFSRAVQVPGVTLPAGSYLFEVVNPETNGTVVRVASRDRSRVYLSRVTVPVERPRSRNMQPQIVLGEAQAGQPPRIASWFPDGATVGHAFIY